MRLDEYLVKMHYFSSRAKAKRAIQAGIVTVNNTVVTKPSFRVMPTDTIAVLNFDYDKPLGYFKLKHIDAQLGYSLIKEGDTVLDVGSGAGGFILYALEKKPKLIVGVEYSEAFKQHLKSIESRYPGRVKIIFGNIMKISLDKIIFNVVLCDITVKVDFALKVVSHLWKKYLARNGILLFSLKLGSDSLIGPPSPSNIYNLVTKKIPGEEISEYRVLKSLEQKKEIFVLCKKS